MVNLTPFLKVEVGDLIEVTKFMCWTFTGRHDYSKASRNWDYVQGWFLVMGTAFESSEGPALMGLELLRIGSKTDWCSVSVWIDDSKNIDPPFSPKLLSHIKLF